MNDLDKNKLKFQLIVMLRHYISDFLIPILFAFSLAVFNHIDVIQAKTGNAGSPKASFWLVVLLSFSSGSLSRVYEKTAPYFISIGYSRERYYKGNIIANIILTIITSGAAVIFYAVLVILDKLYKEYILIPYMGFYFQGFTIKTWSLIILITFVYIAFICALVNLLSIICLSGKVVKILVNIIIITFIGLLIFKETLDFSCGSFIICMTKSIALTSISCIILSVALYFLSKRIFMKIDIG